MKLSPTTDVDDWSAEEHFAAAAALGQFCARLLKMGTWVNHSAYGQGMAADSALQARWMAQDAARHYHLGMALVDERLRDAEAREAVGGRPVTATLNAFARKDAEYQRMARTRRGGRE